MAGAPAYLYTHKVNNGWYVTLWVSSEGTKAQTQLCGTREAADEAGERLAAEYGYQVIGHR